MNGTMPAILGRMLTKVPDTHFGPTTYVRSGLEERANGQPICGREALACHTKPPDQHHCCSAAKILNPTLQAPLSWGSYSKTLAHYGIRMKRSQAQKAYLDYLEDACLAERIEEIDAADSEMERFLDDADASDLAGDVEQAREMRKSADQKIAETMLIVRQARNKAKSLAAVL